MPYVGGSLTSLFGAKAQAATELAVRRMAEAGGDHMVDVTIQNTPIKTGNLRTSWYQLRTNKTHYAVWPAYQSGVATDVTYAPHVEYGTGLWGPRHAKYPIEAKGGGMLRWVDPKTGGEVFARRVMHPGSPGQHMVAIAAEMTEATADKTLYPPILSEWAMTIEAAAD
jgi:hypothetical protein